MADWAVGTSSEAGLGLGACLALCQENVVADEQGEHGEQERTRSTPSPHSYAPPPLRYPTKHLTQVVDTAALSILPFHFQPIYSQSHRTTRVTKNMLGKVFFSLLLLFFAL